MIAVHTLRLAVQERTIPLCGVSTQDITDGKVDTSQSMEKYTVIIEKLFQPQGSEIL